MKENCYITSTRTTHKNKKDEILGPCGPCSLINLLGLKGSFRLEKKLAEKGRLKPSYASGLSSFLVWDKMYKKNLLFYTNTISLPSGALKEIFDYEKIPKNKQAQIKEMVLKRHEKIIRKNKNKIIVFRNKPIDVIDDLLSKRFKLAFIIGVYSSSNNCFVGHYRVCYKKSGKTYYIKDSSKGLMKLSRSRMEKDLSLVKKMNMAYEIIAYRKNQA